MLKALELFTFIAVGVFAIELGINYSHKGREESRHEEVMSTAAVPTTNEEASPSTPATPEQPAEPTTPEPSNPLYIAKCFHNGNQIYGVEHLTDNDFKKFNGGWKFLNIGKKKETSWFNGPCLIEQE